MSSLLNPLKSLFTTAPKSSNFLKLKTSIEDAIKAHPKYQEHHNKNRLEANSGIKDKIQHTTEGVGIGE